MPIKLHFLSSFIPKKKSFSQGRRGEWKDLSFGHIISSHHLQRELEGNKHFTFINFINLLLFSKRQQQVARIEAWSSRKFLFYYCRRQKLPIGSEIRLLCQRAQDDCRVHIYWHQSWYILMVGGFTLSGCKFTSATTLAVCFSENQNWLLGIISYQSEKPLVILCGCQTL